MTTKSTSFPESLGYRGEVTIKLKKNKSKRPFKLIKKKNSVTADFLGIILRGITGLNTDINNRPMGIRLVTSGNTSIGPVPYSVDSALINPADETSTDGIISKSITYTFLVPEIYVSGKTITGLRLVTNTSDSTILAGFDFENPLTVGVNTNLEIKWKIIISGTGFTE